VEEEIMVEEHVLNNIEFSRRRLTVHHFNILVILLDIDVYNGVSNTSGLISYANL
jgi:hypothetical protein